MLLPHHRPAHAQWLVGEYVSLSESGPGCVVAVAATCVCPENAKR